MKTFQLFLNWCMAALLIGILAALIPIQKWLAWLLVFFALSVGAATYFVDPSTGNDANNGTAQGTPWAHLPGSVGFTGTGWVIPQNGDLVYVKGGSMNNCQVLFDSVHYNPSASLDSVQVLSGDVISWGSGRAIFDQQSTRFYGLALGIRGIRVNRLEVRNVAAGPSGLWGNGSAGIEIGSTVTQPNFLHIDDCYIHNCLAGSDQGHAIEAYGPDPNFEASFYVIEHNVIGNQVPGEVIGTKGIESYGSNNTIRANFITGTQDHGIVVSGNHYDVNNNVVYMYPNPYRFQPVFGIKLNFNNNDVWNNLVYSYLITTNATFNSLEGIGTLDNSSFNRILFNTVINCYDLSFNQRCVSFSLGDENAAGTNNILALNIGAFSGSTAGCFADAQIYLGDLTTNCTISYNDIFRTSGSANVVADHFGGSYTCLNSATAMSSSPINGNAFSNLQQVDPSLTGGPLPSGLDGSFHPNTTYFVLQSSTPSLVRVTGQNGYVGTATNGATSTSTKFAADILGVTRNNWSMGAYEWASPPATATNASVIILGNTTISGNVLIK